MALNVASPVPNQKRVYGYGLAWIALCLALAVHVTDEALTDFLSVYNPNAEYIRQRIGLPLPIFTFNGWLTGLIFAIILLLTLSPFAFHNSRLLAILAYGFATLMMTNGLLHILGSIYFGRFMPGVYSSPLLLICSIYLLSKLWNRDSVESHI